VEDAFRLADPMCTKAATESNVDVVTCLERIVGKRIDDMFADEKNGIGSGRCVDVSHGRDINGNDSVAGNRSPLASTVHEIFQSAAMRPQLRPSTMKLLHREIYFRGICISLIKSFVKENKVGSENNLDEIVASASEKTRNAKDFLINFAQAPRGSRVVHSSVPSLYYLTSPPYIPNLLTSVGLLDGYGDASVVISSSIPRNRGDCYAFEGPSGNLTIMLPGPTHITRVGVYQKSGADMDTFAVRVFRVYGWPELPHVLTVKQENEGFSPTFLGEFSIESQFQDTSSPGIFHEFSLHKEIDESPLPRLKAVTFQFEENFGGGNFTCVYRVQLLGEP